MSNKPISEGQLDRGETACRNVVSGPLRAEVLDLRVAQTPEQKEPPCSNERCWRHGLQSRDVRARLGDADTRAYKGHQTRRRLQLLAQKRAAPEGPAAQGGDRDTIRSQALLGCDIPAHVRVPVRGMSYEVA